MASTKEYLEFVLEQLSSLSDISYRAMMGEYLIYYEGKSLAEFTTTDFLLRIPKPEDASCRTRSLRYRMKAQRKCFC